MTQQELQDAVVAAQKKFFDAQAAAKAAQATFDGQNADYEASKTAALVTVPAENAQRLAAAQNLYLQKLAALPGLQQRAIDAWNLVGTTHQEYLAAIQAALAGNAQEQVGTTHTFPT